jgi:altronate dehydratase
VSGKRRCIALDPQDNVATAIEQLKVGEKVETEYGNVALTQPIAYGHKFALRDIRKGDYVIKYGTQIGRAIADISKGQHVHVHNVEDIVDEIRKQ